MIERIDTICLQVSNVDEASKWYQEKLGFKESYRGNTYRIMSIGDSGVPLTIEEGDLTTSESRTYPIFFAKELEKTYQELKEKGVSVGEIKVDGVNNFFDFYDLDKNKLQVCFWE